MRSETAPEPRTANAKGAARSARPIPPASAETPAPAAAAASGPDSGTTPRVTEIDANIMGPRKLIRPTLPARALQDRSFSRRNDPVLAHHAAMLQTPSSLEASHAEAFYFQKQMQAQTQMVFVLEDGETIEGYIEWYDRNAIKVRNSTRTLIYKAGIKYLYKAGENRTSF
uniref:RNA chaperone Hfq n=1 Tax=Paracidobacterium acidisoli TaxID=2303751 RepID=A0A372IU92_9BACT